MIFFGGSQMTWFGIAALALLLGFGVVGYMRGFIKEVVSMTFLVLSIGIVWLINPAVSSIIKEHTAFYTEIKERCAEGLEKKIQPGVQVGRETQMTLIDQMPLPKEIKKGLMTNNNPEIYKLLKVDSFMDYVADYVATIMTNGVGSIVSFILAFVSMKILVCTLGFMSKLPVLRGVDRMAGGVVGLAKGMIALWILGLVATVLCDTRLGGMCMDAIEEDRFLSLLYDLDLFVKVFINIFYDL